MSGRSWRRLAIVLAVLVNMDLADQIMGWVPGEWGVALGFVVAVVAVLGFTLLPLKEQPTCGFRLPIVVPDSKNKHHEHHCAEELGHIGPMHRCRCGLGYVPDEVRS